jgi:SseB protein N-terminal domain
VRSVPDPGFAGDDGVVDPRVLAALEGHDEIALEVALLQARVFVPLMALLGASETGPDGLRRDKTSDIAVVTVQRPDGARALPVFSSTGALESWDASARPQPVEGQRAALATYAEGAVALLVDPGSPASAVLFGPLLLALAEGRAWLPPAEDPDIADAVAEHVPPGVAWRLEPSPAADVLLVLTYPLGTSPDDARASAVAVAGVLADVPVLRARLSSGLDVSAELAPAGNG